MTNVDLTHCFGEPGPRRGTRDSRNGNFPVRKGTTCFIGATIQNFSENRDQIKILQKQKFEFLVCLRIVIYIVLSKSY